MEVKTNGKLYVAGEYQVLSDKGVAVIKGVNKGMNFRITPNIKFYYETRGKKYFFEYKEGKTDFLDNKDNILIDSAITCALEYLEFKKIEIEPFGLLVSTELENKEGIKYGFGSSSALISGIIKSILSYVNLDVISDVIFKLSVLVQNRIGSLTSGGDLAAAIYGDYVYYQRYNKKWFLKNSKKNNISIVEKKWNNLIISPFTSKMDFVAIWTKKSYETPYHDVNISKSSLKDAKRLVNGIYVSLKDNNYLKLKQGIKDYQKWLNNNLDKEIFTKEIMKALEITSRFNLATKISGAGGGDSLICLVPNGYDFKEFKMELSKNDLELIML
ncbi:MAG: hypothetical protein RBQ97_04590 [Acholeplasma sp.]|nr:hypothetical protein [Acholeplasma sp.]